MAERTLSIVIEVDGAQQSAAAIRRVRSALDDLSGSAAGLQRLARQGREINTLFKEMTAALDYRGRSREMLGGIEDFFRTITAGARNAGDVFKNIWREAADYVSRLWHGLGRSQGTSGSSGASLRELGGSLIGPLTGHSNRGLSTLGGLGSGALAGFSVGGPVGAVVGGLIGGIAGFFGSSGGKEKRRDAEIANQGFAQLRQILDDYNQFRRDFASSVDSANRIWSQMQAQWARPQSAPSQRPFFEAILRSMQSTEDERNRRRQVQALLPVPQFAAGGLVHGAGGAGTLAVVHPGEFVMSKRAVDQLGVSALSDLNRGGAAPGGAVTISLEPASAQSLGEMLKRNPQALEEGLLVVLRRGSAVSRALRA